MFNPKSPVIVAAFIANAFWILLTTLEQMYRGVPAW